MYKKINCKVGFFLWLWWLFYMVNVFCRVSVYFDYFVNLYEERYMNDSAGR